QLIDSYCHDLIEGVPAVRRKYLDWCIFYDHADYLRLWKLYMRALKQRNAALKGYLPKAELDSWTHELVTTAFAVNQLRQQYTQYLTPIINEVTQELLGIIPALKISYYAGWNTQYEYAQILQLNREKDSQFQHTQFGPHKADIKITINDIPAKDILSRGQQKLFVCAMIVARGALVQGR